MLSDWIVYRLSGVAVTEPSCGSSSGMFRLSARDWSGEIARICGISPDVLPEVVDPGTVVGAVTATAAEQTGLRAGPRWWPAPLTPRPDCSGRACGKASSPSWPGRSGRTPCSWTSR